MRAVPFSASRANDENMDLDGRAFGEQGSGEFVQGVLTPVAGREWVHCQADSFQGEGSNRLCAPRFFEDRSRRTGTYRTNWQTSTL